MPDTRSLAGHDPLSLFALTVEGARVSMTPGPWMVDAAAQVHAGALAVLAETGWGMVGYLANGVRARTPVAASLSIEFVPGTAWFSEDSVVSVAEVTHLDDDGVIVRGVLEGASATLVAFGAIHMRFVPVPADYEPLVESDNLAPDPTLGLADIFDPEVTLVEGGSVVTLESAQWLGNALAGMQGGVVAALVEFAASTAIAGGYTGWQPSSLRVDFHRPVTTGGRVTVTSTVIQSGRTLSLIRVDLARADGKLCVTGTVAYSRRA